MKKSFFFLPLLLALASCEEVIQLELDTAEQR
ncbi:MAG: lipoprotein, partial [Saprospiraceae bacterium]